MTKRSRRLARRYSIELRGLDKRQQRRLVRRAGRRRAAKRELFRLAYSNGHRFDHKLLERQMTMYGSVTGRLGRMSDGLDAATLGMSALGEAMKAAAAEIEADRRARELQLHFRAMPVLPENGPLIVIAGI